MHKIGIFFPNGIGNGVIFSDFLRCLSEKSKKVDILVSQKGTYELFNWLTEKFENINVIRITQKFSLLKLFLFYDKFGIYDMYNYKSILIGLFASKKIVFFTDKQDPIIRKILPYKLTAINVSESQSEHQWGIKFLIALLDTSHIFGECLIYKLFSGLVKSDRRHLIICVHPGCNPIASYKRWAVDNYINLINSVHLKYNVDLVLVGTKDEADIADEIAKKVICKTNNYVDRTKLQETGHLIQKSSLFISGDSGMMHLCSKIGTPQVAIFNNLTGKHKNVPKYINPMSRSLFPTISQNNEINFPDYNIVELNVMEVISEICA